MVIEEVLLWMVAKSCTLDGFSSLQIMGCLPPFSTGAGFRTTVGCNGGAPEGPEVALSGCDIFGGRLVPQM